MSAMASQITGVSIARSSLCSGADESKHQNSAPLAFVRGIHRWPMDSPLKRPVTRKMVPFDDIVKKHVGQHSMFVVMEKNISSPAKIREPNAIKLIVLWWPCTHAVLCLFFVSSCWQRVMVVHASGVKKLHCGIRSRQHGEATCCLGNLLRVKLFK